MNREDVYTLATVVIAVSTFIGVGAAIAYYLKEIIKDNPFHIVLLEIEYILVAVITLILIKRNLK